MKKRYMMTLTQSTVEEAHSMLKELGLGKPALSALVDDQLTNFLPVLIKMVDAKRQGKQLTFDEIMGEVFQTIGKAMKP